jgi:hypothetical protein
VKIVSFLLETLPCKDGLKMPTKQESGTKNKENGT